MLFSTFKISLLTWPISLTKIFFPITVNSRQFVFRVIQIVSIRGIMNGAVEVESFNDVQTVLFHPKVFKFSFDDFSLFFRPVDSLKKTFPVSDILKDPKVSNFTNTWSSRNIGTIAKPKEKKSKETLKEIHLSNTAYWIQDSSENCKYLTRKACIYFVSTLL